jgi:hypothetical protein
MPHGSSMGRDRFLHDYLDQVLKALGTPADQSDPAPSLGAEEGRCAPNPLVAPLTATTCPVRGCHSTRSLKAGSPPEPIQAKTGLNA